MRLLPNLIAPLIFGLLFVPLISSAADPPKSFRNLNWGAPPPRSLKRISGPTSDGTTLYVPRENKRLPSLLDVPVAEEAYSFSKGKFFSGLAWLNGRENLDKMKAALVKKYGQPSFANERLGLFKWKWPSSKIEVHLSYQAKFSRTTVTFLNNAI